MKYIYPYLVNFNESFYTNHLYYVQTETSILHPSFIERSWVGRERGGERGEGLDQPVKIRPGRREAGVPSRNRRLETTGPDEEGVDVGAAADEKKGEIYGYDVVSVARMVTFVPRRFY